MSIRIVCCDDEAHITRAVSMKLSKAGFDVETHFDGQAGFEAIKREKPALLITDYQMPRLNGLQLCQKLQADEVYCDIPILLLTAKGFELDESQIQAEYGVSQVVVKPFSPRLLLRTVQETLGITETQN